MTLDELINVGCTYTASTYAPDDPRSNVEYWRDGLSGAIGAVMRALYAEVNKTPPEMFQRTTKRWTPPTEPLDQTAVGPPMDKPKQQRIAEARIQGFEGDACPTCGNFTLVRNGTCLKCQCCGSTTGCS